MAYRHNVTWDAREQALLDLMMTPFLRNDAVQRFLLTFMEYIMDELTQLQVNCVQEYPDAEERRRCVSDFLETVYTDTTDQEWGAKVKHMKRPVSELKSEYRTACMTMIFSLYGATADKKQQQLTIRLLPIAVFARKLFKRVYAHRDVRTLDILAQPYYSQRLFFVDMLRRAIHDVTVDTPNVVQLVRTEEAPSSHGGSYVRVAADRHPMASAAPTPPMPPVIPAPHAPPVVSREPWNLSDAPLSHHPTPVGPPREPAATARDPLDTSQYNIWNCGPDDLADASARAVHADSGGGQLTDDRTVVGSSVVSPPDVVTCTPSVVDALSSMSEPVPGVDTPQMATRDVAHFVDDVVPAMVDTARAPPMHAPTDVDSLFSAAVTEVPHAGGGGSVSVAYGEPTNTLERVMSMVPKSGRDPPSTLVLEGDTESAIGPNDSASQVAPAQFVPTSDHGSLTAALLDRFNGFSPA